MSEALLIPVELNPRKLCTGPSKAPLRIFPSPIHCQNFFLNDRSPVSHKKEKCYLCERGCKPCEDKEAHNCMACWVRLKKYICGSVCELHVLQKLWCIDPSLIYSAFGVVFLFYLCGQRKGKERDSLWKQWPSLYSNLNRGRVFTSKNSLFLSSCHTIRLPKE